MMLVLALIAAFAVAEVLIGLAAFGVTRSKHLGIVAGVTGAVLGCVHLVHVWITALASEDEEITGYAAFALDNFAPLLAVYLLAPAVVLVGARAARRRLRGQGRPGYP